MESYCYCQYFFSAFLRCAHFKVYDFISERRHVPDSGPWTLDTGLLSCAGPPHLVPDPHPVLARFSPDPPPTCKLSHARVRLCPGPDFFKKIKNGQGKIPWPRLIIFVPLPDPLPPP